MRPGFGRQPSCLRFRPRDCVTAVRSAVVASQLLAGDPAPFGTWALPHSVRSDISHFPKLALFATKAEALAAWPEAVVDAEFAWECQLRIVSGPADGS